MPTPLLLEPLDPSMESATLSAWHKKAGDTVSTGDVLADIETDKATLELESPATGTLAMILISEGTDNVAVGTPLAFILHEGESEDDIELTDKSAAESTDTPVSKSDTGKPGGGKAERKDFDVVIVGGGPGGYVAAIRASQLGHKTALIEREHLGGVCLNWGCIPTKALLRSAEVFELMHRAEEFGLSTKGVDFDIAKVVKRSRDISSQLASGVSHLMKKNKIEVIWGEARLLGKGALEISGKQPSSITAEHIVIATGARPRSLPNLEPDGELVWSYHEAMTPKSLPKSLLVVGAGAIGVEFASFYNTMGTEVTIVEAAPSILPVEDKDISRFVAKALKQKGITIHTETTVETLERNRKDVVAHLKTGNEIQKTTFDRVISAVGVIGNHEALGLSATAVKVKSDFIDTDAWGRTAEAGVYAIGDVAGAPCLAHKASHEAVICVEQFSGVPGVHSLNKDLIPGCTYCNPQVASVGLTEEQARDKGHEVKVGKFPFIGNGKAIALGDTEGLIKTVFDAKTGELLGAHMVGAEVTELIQGFGIAQQLETTEQELMQTVFAHPTLSEMMHESVLDAFKRAIHH